MAYNVHLVFEDGEETDLACEPDEDVVTAALRQGLILMTECREGICSTCKCFLAEGDYDELLTHSIYALSPNEEEQGYVLACRLRPTSDIELEFDYPSSMVERFEETCRAGYIESLEMVSATVLRLVVRTLQAQDPFQYIPGQYVRLTLASGTSRDFSMAGCRSDGRLLEFFVRVYPDGAFSGQLARDVQVGDPITVEGPSGKFVYRRTDTAPVFIAGGTGIAPIAAMLRHLAEESPDLPMQLIFGNTNPTDVFFEDQLRELRQRLPNLEIHMAVMHPDPGWEGITGTCTDAIIAVIADPTAHQYYYCGPPVMIEATTALLERLGVPRERRHHEDFLPSALVEPHAAAECT